MAFAAVCNAATDVIPIAPVGDVAGVQSILGNENSRLYYQDVRGYLVQVGVSAFSMRIVNEQIPERVIMIIETKL